MWEAFEHAAHYELDNLTAIIDVNRLGQRGETMVGWDLDDVRRARGGVRLERDRDRRARRRGDRRRVRSAVATTGRPTVVVARTMKGKGVAAVENENGLHGKPLDDPEAAIAELGGRHGRPRRRRRSPTQRRPSDPPPARSSSRGTSSARRSRRAKAYGEALAALGAARPDVVALDGEVSNSTFAETFEKAHPDRFFEMYIAEQQLVAAAVGLQAVGWRPFASTFAAFLSRAYDFVRMAAISRATFSLCGSHAGRLDRRGRPVADGARGHRGAPGRPRLDRPPPLRREPDREARRGDGGYGGHLVPAHAPPRDAGALLAGRGVRDRRKPRPALERRATRSR